MIVFALAALSTAAADDFKGFYVGANGGGAFGRGHVDTSPIFSSTGYFATTSTPAITAVSSQKVEPSGFTAGGQGGYNFQWDKFVLGFEADFGVLNLEGSTTATATYPCCAPTSFTVNQSLKTNWMFTARPRMGVVFGKVLLYETAGIAVTKVKYSALFTDTFATAKETAAFDELRPGYVVGGGGEFRVNHHWSVKGEYLYAGFPEHIVTSTNLTAFTPPIPFPSNIFTHTARLNAHIARAGINFRF
jgi:outer membrane immunogenic protein